MKNEVTKEQRKGGKHSLPLVAVRPPYRPPHNKPRTTTRHAPCRRKASYSFEYCFSSSQSAASIAASSFPMFLPPSSSLASRARASCSCVCVCVCVSVSVCVVGLCSMRIRMGSIGYLLKALSIHPSIN